LAVGIEANKREQKCARYLFHSLDFDYPRLI
jgi:hypothetical protein